MDLAARRVALASPGWRYGATVAATGSGKHSRSCHRGTTGANAAPLTATYGGWPLGVAFRRGGASVRDSRTVVLTWQQLLMLAGPMYPPLL